MRIGMMVVTCMMAAPCFAANFAPSAFSKSPGAFKRGSAFSAPAAPTNGAAPTAVAVPSPTAPAAQAPAPVAASAETGMPAGGIQPISSAQEQELEQQWQRAKQVAEAANSLQSEPQLMPRKIESSD